MLPSTHCSNCSSKMYYNLTLVGWPTIFFTDKKSQDPCIGTKKQHNSSWSHTLVYERDFYLIEWINFFNNTFHCWLGDSMLFLYFENKCSSWLLELCSIIHRLPLWRIIIITAVRWQDIIVQLQHRLLEIDRRLSSADLHHYATDKHDHEKWESWWTAFLDHIQDYNKY